jgi:hypothetical protein
MSGVSARRALRLDPVALALAWLALACIAVAAPPRAHPLAGTWEADLSQSTFKGRAPYRTGKMTFRVAKGDTVHVVADVVTASGAPFHFEYAGPEDGSVLKVTGNPYYDAASIMWADAQTLVRTERRADKLTGTTVMKLAADGKSFTASSSRSAPEDGHLYTSVIVWKRVG